MRGYQLMAGQTGMTGKKIVLTTIGTRGDVQPYMALALGLKRAGYRVKLAAPANFQDWVEGAGLEFARCGPDTKAFVTSPEIRAYLARGVFYQAMNARKVGLSLLKSITEDIYHATEDADAVIFHPKADFSVDVAEAKNIPAIMAAFQPFTPTIEFPLMLLPWGSLGPWLNKASYGLIYLSRALYNGYLNECRRDYLDLPPRRFGAHPTAINGSIVPILYAFSEHVVPRPKDWPADAHITGYWFLDENPDWVLPQDLREFIEAGDAPIYIGFGSMPLKDAQGAAEMFGAAIRANGMRAVMARGWADFIANEIADGVASGGEGGPNDRGDIFFLDEAPHEHLFGAMSGVVHHGGAGTTSAGLRAGCPTLVCPLLVDQPFWGRRVAGLGCGPSPLPPKTWSVEVLAASLKALTENTAYRSEARLMGARLEAEDGVGRAVGIVQDLVG